MLLGAKKGGVSFAGNKEQAMIYKPRSEAEL